MSSFQSSFYWGEEGKQSVQWRLGKDFSVEFQTYLILTSDIFHRISTPVCSFRENLPCFAETQIVLTFESFLWLMHERWRTPKVPVARILSIPVPKKWKIQIWTKVCHFSWKMCFKSFRKTFQIHCHRFMIIIIAWQSLIIINMTLIWLSLHDNNLKIFYHG